MEIIQRKELPQILREIPDPPGFLYKKGAALSEDLKYVAIVGTRMPSRYGLEMAYSISKAITEAGGTVVSGLAFGVDAAVHKAAVDLGQPTIALLASGVDCVTPSSHSKLARDILGAGGSLLSEYERFDSAHKYRFLARNRLISGLCSATIIIEAKERSGALITARHAFDQNRDVYALMGDITRPQAKGCLNLVARDMARPIVDIERLLEDIGFNKKESVMSSLDINSVLVLKIMKNGAISSSEIIEKSGLDASEINTSLSMLEIKNLIEKNSSGRWTIKQTLW